MKSNLQIQQDVLDELKFEPRVNAAQIGIMTNDGIVTLTGRVQTYVEKWAAARAAERVAGVQAVADEIKVELHATHHRRDEDIAKAVLNAFAWDVLVPSDRIKIKVQHGHVTLDGTVDYKYQQIAAERAIRNLIGVQGVDNLIVVKPVATPREVKEKIENALKRAAEVDAQRISVDVFGDKVTLRGTVRSWAERSAAEHAAWSAPGVCNVEDDLVITA